MKEIIDTFRMDEVPPKIRADIIIKLGNLINHEYASNITESLVFTLVKTLDPSNRILNDAHYILHYQNSTGETL